MHDPKISSYLTHTTEKASSGDFFPPVAMYVSYRVYIGELETFPTAMHKCIVLFLLCGRGEQFNLLNRTGEIIFSDPSAFL